MWMPVTRGSTQTIRIPTFIAPNPWLPLGMVPMHRQAKGWQGTAGELISGATIWARAPLLTTNAAIEKAATRADFIDIVIAASPFC
jgi:hypothetical protein